jgi:tetratricopeptide (TPR) repeat protein
MLRTHFVLPLFCLLTFWSEARPQPAGGDAAAAWLSTPYKLDIVLHIQDHPLFTQVYKDLLQRELIDALKRDLGKIAEVEASKHPWMEAVVKQGWSFLDGRQVPLDERKHHFVRVFYQDGQYEVQARQVDGTTGYVSTLRKARTADRMWVSRIAALMVAHDFGITGKVTEVNGTTVRLHLKGVGVEAPPSVRVLGREVFYVVAIHPGRDGKPYGEKVEDTVLVVTGSQIDACQTRLVSRYQNIINPRDRSVLEYRAIKLGTQYMPLQLRVIDKKTGQPLPGHGVAVSPDGFQNMRELGSTDALGRVRSNESFHNVVCVRVTYSGRSRLMTPIALLDDQVVEKALAGTQEADDVEAFIREYRKWQLGLGRLYTAVEADFRQISEHLAAKRVAEAVDFAKQQAVKLKEDLENSRKGLETLRNAAASAAKTGEAAMKAGESELATVAAKIKEMDDFVEEQVNPTPAQTQYRHGRILEDAADIEEAMKAYQEALELDQDNKLNPKAKAHIGQVQRVWEIKKEDHQAARDFIFKKWDKVEPEELLNNLPDAEKHLKTCIKYGDYLTVRKLNKANLAHRERLLAAIKRLEEIDSDEAAEKLELLNKALDGIYRNLWLKATDFLQKNMPR